MTDIPIILLAAGQSSRMGGVDKLLQMIDGVPLLTRSARSAQAVGPVLAALPPKPHPRYDALNGLDVQAVPVPDAEEGMNASLRAAMRRVSSDAPAVMVLLADLPDLSSANLAAVLNARKTHPDKLVWRGATAQGKPGHPVIFDRSLFGQLSDLQGDDGAQQVVRAHQGKVHLHRLPDRNALLDLDTPDDWNAWLKKRRLK
ncbi:MULTISPECIES: NTP transferase domain-containing protein [unclassified Ruegeria]|uniref:nucleotidyltransferase family protein n=1 Tax=unclassified Ruegeria TaxID=2625375 RepID=UPI001490BC0F|nr:MULTISPECIES: nucleotidyltransferase family protein [unclassified Ruegeria]NOD75195.1 NTP transferase domain-containing protein [Ruegeria sp. HKCCD4332]NOD87156.1 NTP transferase domain-containing protein [Ruegeria sp. HKCCD4318]NOD91268.1 NTP transferase domain-containing protein [Ruegeria sp. HKCCD4884]NOE12711.1 NTP transferase domain-containing protein [Ruegeria sp. HKCCD4318-2]NOG09124.1 nucleotidyltransferase family protein [Ruegeria sp. HKCCD4315]